MEEIRIYQKRNSLLVEIPTGDSELIGVKSASINQSRFRFTTAIKGTNVNFFSASISELPDASNFSVLINGALTDQSYTSITFNANDDIIIEAKNDNTYYPVISFSDKTLSCTDNIGKLNVYVKSVLEPLPPMYITQGEKVSSLDRFFYRCPHLEQVCDDLFINNSEVTSFKEAFFECDRLTYIPSDLFFTCENVKDFSYCFYGSGLQDVPSDLFVNNKEIVFINRCFYGVVLFSYLVNLTTTGITKCDDFIQGNGVINVPANSITFNSFSSVDITGATVNGISDFGDNVTADGKFVFKVAVRGIEVNFFEQVEGSLPDSSNFMVLINGQRTNQKYTSITFTKDDVITIQKISSDAYYPRIYFYNEERPSYSLFLKQVLEPLPVMYKERDTKITFLDGLFRNCANLESICVDVFRNNPEIVSFRETFYGCSKLADIPSTTFSSCDNVLDFSGCFCNTGISFIPNTLFSICTKVENFQSTFENTKATNIPEDLFDNNLDIRLLDNCFFNTPSANRNKITVKALDVASANNIFPPNGNSTVVVKQNSLTETTMRRVSGITVETKVWF